MPVFILQRAVYTALFLLLLLFSVHGECAEVPSPSITINLPSRMLELYSDNEFVKEYPVAIGKPSTPTPLGNFSIINKEVDPVWIPPRKGYIVQSGPDNPLGYRWMGFLPLYGIHGTNAPWAIGLAVSNGCVRMHEEDAEELFDIVSYGTPVMVTYDRIKVRINASGEVSVGIYPDIYGYKSVSVADVYSILENYGLSGFVNQKLIEQLIEEEADKQIPVARIVKLKINDKVLNQCAVQTGDILYVPVWAVAGALKIDIAWNEVKQQVQGKTNIVPGVVKGDVLYVTASDLQSLFGGQQLLQTEENCLEINALDVIVNGKLLTNDVQSIDGVLAVPVLSLCEALNEKVVWDSAKGALMSKGRTVPYKLINNQPYIQINRINEYFNAFVFWNQQTRRVEITYPMK